MKTLELEQRIVDLYKAAGFPFDRMDIGITLMKMSEEQTDDLVAMIDTFEALGHDPDYIAENIDHDLSGLKSGFLNVPGSECFLPRSHGYSALPRA